VQGAEWTRIARPTIADGPISHSSLTLFLQNGSRHRSMFGLGKSTSRLGESSSSVRTGHRRLLRLLRRRYLRSGVGRSGAAMRVLSRRGGPVRGCDACPVTSSRTDTERRHTRLNGPGLTGRPQPVRHEPLMTCYLSKQSNEIRESRHHDDRHGQPRLSALSRCPTVSSKLSGYSVTG
jgi:hypothetical protein